MFGPESIKQKEGRQIPIKIVNEAREVVAGLWGMDHRLLDQFASEAMALRRYDMPLTFLAELTKVPVRLTRNPGGFCTAIIDAFYQDNRQFGDCAGLCYQLGLDDNLWNLLTETKKLSGSRLVPYLAKGLSPTYFCQAGQVHYWLSLWHEKSGSMITIDPSFQTISLGAGYEIAEDGLELLEKRKVPRGILAARRDLAKYEERSNPALLHFVTQAQFSILGMTKARKILSLAFSEGGSNLQPILPIAGLIDQQGQIQFFYQTPNLKTILNTNTQQPPSGGDAETLAEFFSLANNFSFTWGNY